MLLAVSAASVSAQTYQIRKDSVKTGEYSPTVYLVSVNAPQLLHLFLPGILAYNLPRFGQIPIV